MNRGRTFSKHRTVIDRFSTLVKGEVLGHALDY
jgi:hypothetical protein